MTFQPFLAIIIFVAVYLIISFELINKASIAALGASLLLLFGILTPEEAFASINLHVIFLLTSLMVIANITGETGLLYYSAIKIVKLARGDGMRILLLLSILTGVISAFLDNVTSVIMLCPLAILIAVELQISPVPFIITMAIASNTGGTATLIGDPPNIMIGYSANLNFFDFLNNEGMLIVLIGSVYIGITILLFRKSLITSSERRYRIMMFEESGTVIDAKLSIKVLLVWIFIIAGFIFQNLTNISPTITAMSGASVLLVLTKTKPEKFFANVEWVTIVFFIGLFIIIGALEKTGCIDFIAQHLIKISDGKISMTSLSILWGSGILSGIIDNIPFVAVMIPLIHEMNSSIAAQDGNVLWWSLSTGACLGGNFTLIGATANIVAVEIAKKSGYEIKFAEFTKYGIIYTLIGLCIASVYIYLRYLLH